MTVIVTYTQRVMLLLLLVFMIAYIADAAGGIIVFPPAQYKWPFEAHLQSAVITPDIDPAFQHQDWSASFSTASDIDTARVAAFSEALHTSKFQSIRALIDHVAPTCGNSRLDIPPVDVSTACEFRWQHDPRRSEKANGPCEIWLDDTRVFSSFACTAPSTMGIPAKISMTYDECKGTCVLRFYWLQVTGSTWPVYKHCVPIHNGDRPEEYNNSELGGHIGSMAKSQDGECGNGEYSDAQTDSMTDPAVSTDVITSGSLRGTMDMDTDMGMNYSGNSIEKKLSDQDALSLPSSSEDCVMDELYDNLDDSYNGFEVFFDIIIRKYMSKMIWSDNNRKSDTMNVTRVEVHEIVETGWNRQQHHQHGPNNVDLLAAVSMSHRLLRCGADQTKAIRTDTRTSIADCRD